jgi:2-methylcitrate dehydratase PrpD
VTASASGFTSSDAAAASARGVPGPDAPPARVLAEFAAGLTLADLPGPTKERVKDLLLDALASALGGVGDDTTAIMLDLARSMMGTGDVPVIGGTDRLSPGGAAFVNGHLISSVSLCDVHYRSWCHLTPGVVPPALAVAAGRGSSGAQLLLATAAGCELTARIGLGLNYPAFHARGWNTSGVAGVFGAAASAAVMLGLSGAQMTHALGIAGAQAAGSDAHRGTPTVRFLQPRAALSGLMAAELAARGVTAMADVLTHPVGGVYTMYSDGGTPAAALAGLGQRWELEDIWLTPWPLALLVRNIVNTTLDLAERADTQVSDLASARLWISPRAYELYGAMGFDTQSRAKTSPRYLVSVVLHDRACSAQQFLPGRLGDPSVRSFAADRVAVMSDPGLPERAVRAELTLRDGTSVTHLREVPHGDASDPLTRAEITDKFRREAAPVLAEQQIASVIDLVGRLEELDSVEPLLLALSR